jgi:hypothetical protein
VVAIVQNVIYPCHVVKGKTLSLSVLATLDHWRYTFDLGVYGDRCGDKENKKRVFFMVSLLLLDPLSVIIIRYVATDACVLELAKISSISSHNVDS